MRDRARDKSLIERVATVMEGKRPTGPFPVGGDMGLSFSVLYLEGVEEGASAICVPQFIVDLTGLYRPLRLKGGVAFPLDTVQSPEDFIGKCLTGLDRAMEQALVVLKDAREDGLGAYDEVKKAIAAIEGEALKEEVRKAPECVRSAAKALSKGCDLPYFMFLGGSMYLRVSGPDWPNDSFWRVFLVNRVGAGGSAHSVGRLFANATEEEHISYLMNCIEATKKLARPWAESLLHEAQKQQAIADRAQQQVTGLRRDAKDALEYAAYWEGKACGRA